MDDQHQPEIEFNICIPPRTGLDLSVSSEELKQNKVIKIDQRHINEYYCVDCSFRTKSLEMIEAHQENQKKHHNWLQRFKRWFDFRRGLMLQKIKG